MTPKLLVDPQIEPEAPEQEAKGRADSFEPARGAGQATVAHLARLVQRVFLSSEPAPRRQVLFSSVDEYGGATEVSSLAARLLAEQGGRSVCLVDAHTSHPRPANRPGAGRAMAQPIGTNLWQVDCGQLVEVSALNAQKEQLIRLRGEYDYVLVDAPSIGHSEAAVVLGSMVDGVILVLRAGKTRRIAARRAKQMLEEAGVTVLGAVLWDRTFPVPEAIYRRI